MYMYQAWLWFVLKIWTPSMEQYPYCVEALPRLNRTASQFNRKYLVWCEHFGEVVESRFGLVPMPAILSGQGQWGSEHARERKRERESETDREREREPDRKREPDRETQLEKQKK